MKIISFEKKEAGQSLLELLLAIGVFFIGVVTVSLMYANITLGSAGSLEKNRAIFLAEEGIEAVRSIRNYDYYYLYQKAQENEGVDLYLTVGYEEPFTDRWIFYSEEETIDELYSRVVRLYFPEELPSGMIEVEVVITWDGVLQDGREIILREVMGKYY